ncbi:MAG: transposase family protein [Deltaproteobacteria bacterium]|nr:transposase family protein [Deltaproteobacteria bacterium]
MWVKQEIIRLKALMPEAGCRKIAYTFNRIFAQSREMTVSKTFANGIMGKHNYEIQVLRRKIKNSKPRDVARNLVWGMDLTGKEDEHGNLNNILGIVEHKSRMSLGLVAIKDKSTITILRFLFDVVEHYGKPKFLRTDNEAVFTSCLMRFSLWLMGIRHQRIALCCPWQNGRIERFFGTLKEKLNQWHVENREQLNGALTQFQFWYNHIRPHQNLNGRTPAEVWNGKDVFNQRPKQEYWFEVWDGLLTGIYLRL